MIARVDNWAAELNAAIDEARNKPFEWGDHDCCQFAGKVVAAMTGVDFSQDTQGTYSTRRESLAVIKSLGAESVEDIATASLGAPINPRLAQRGDVATVKTPFGEALGICIGPKIAAPGADGLEFHPLTAALKCWRV